MGEFLPYEKTEKTEGPKERPYTEDEMRAGAIILPTAADFLVELFIQGLTNELPLLPGQGEGKS